LGAYPDTVLRFTEKNLLLHSHHGYNIIDSVAQLVEQYTFNVWVLGSNPSGITKRKRLFTQVDSLFLFVSFLMES
jgi:hypothetical protein